MSEELGGPEPIMRYQGRIEMVEGSSVFSFFALNASLNPQGVNRFRLWGVNLTTSIGAKQRLEGKADCRIMGTVWGYNVGTVRIVSCFAKGFDLGAALIEAGYGSEICGETNGYYGTCRPKEKYN